jgi:hypothetical protein
MKFDTAGLKLNGIRFKAQRRSHDSTEKLFTQYGIQITTFILYVNLPKKVQKAAPLQ